MHNTTLRVMVATIEGQFDELTKAMAAGVIPDTMVAELRASWATLARLLPLAEPVLQSCPICRRVLPRAATFCGTCFSSLNPAASYDA